MAAAIVQDVQNNLPQIYHFDAYGNLLNFDTATPLTSYLYSGEAFDFNIGQQYLRARWYDATNGRFNRLDPFLGNSSDPQSFHKYAYVHGDPIQLIDPTGKFGLVGRIAVAVGIGGLLALNYFVISPKLNALRSDFGLNSIYLHLAQENRQRTADYAGLYLKNPKIYKWAGMAALASDKVGFGIFAIENGLELPREFAFAAGVNPYEILAALHKGNKEVHEDMIRQFKWYEEGGVVRMKQAFDAGEISQLQYSGWQDIAAGDAQNDDDLIWSGNAKLLEHEQTVVLQHGVYDLHFAAFERLSPYMTSPIPGGGHFYDTVFQGNIADSNHRMRWIVNGMLPDYQQFEATPRMTTSMHSLLNQAR
ncbi:MAG: RHS repeat-associated core domain-containing protein [Planctomycetota bacterium]